jgi:hypothetical protein
MDIRRRRSVRGTGGGVRVTPHRRPGEVTAPGPRKPNHRGQIGLAK